MVQAMLRVGETICDWPLMSPIAGTKAQRSVMLPAAAAVVLLLLCFSAAVMGLMFLLPSFAAIRLVYDFHTLLLPIILSCCALAGLTYWNRRPYERGLLRVCVLFLASSAGLVGIRAYATHIEPRNLQVRHEVIQTDKVLHPFRILHVSDIQSAHVGEYEEDVFRQIKKLAPDLMVFTGDLLQPLPPATREEESLKMSALIESLHTSNRVIAVRGDVDSFFARNPEAIPAINWLSDEAIQVETSAGTLNLFGLSRENSRSGFCERVVTNWLEGAAPGQFTILLSHPPDFINEVGHLPIDLCLAGHTHGGQIRLPLFGPILTLSDAPRNLCLGFNKVGATQLNVSGGVGCEHTSGVPDIRINCPPEMTLIEIVPSASAKTLAHGKEQ